MDTPPAARSRSDWPLLFRAIGLASDPRCLILGAIGMLAIVAGERAIASAFGESSTDPAAFGRLSAGSVLSWSSVDGGQFRVSSPILGPIAAVIRPFVGLFGPDATAADRLRAAASGLWAMVISSLFGGAIVRVAAARLARGERVGVVSALRFTFVRLGPLLAAPLAPLAVAWLIGMGGAAVGLLDRLPAPFGTSIAAVMAIVPLIVGILDAVILIGLIGAWPLMVATVQVEGEDFFDALSRSYSYVNQRTARYAAYLLLAGAIAIVGLAVVSLVVPAILGLADWSVALGAPRGVGFRFREPSTIDASGLPSVARFWRGVVDAVVDGWSFSYVWATAAILYLVLRRDVDGAEIHDIYSPSHDADEFIPDGPKPEASADQPAS